jgi:hypothetical protein
LQFKTADLSMIALLSLALKVDIDDVPAVHSTIKHQPATRKNLKVTSKISSSRRIISWLTPALRVIVSSAGAVSMA